MASAAAVAMPRQPPGLVKAKPILSIDATNLPKPVVIPTILITPPDAPHKYSSSIPEQQYEKSVLFVPVKTEELGWDEHGLYWNGTYAYPVHQIYNKEGKSIGRRRKGPHGYRFEEYYENKQPRRFSSPASSCSPLLEDTVEEASVRLQEPAPARIEDLATAAVSEEPAEASKQDALDEEEEEDIVSPSSPAMSIGSDMTEDGTSFCDDASSLWSRNDVDSDDEDDVESRCTSPGLMSPPMELDTPELQAETLSKKLGDLKAGEKISKSGWLPLGSLPSSSSASASSSASSSRSQSLPTARTSSSTPALEISRNHRATSTLVMDPPRESRRASSGSAYASIIQDLSTSPFASARTKTPYRSATLPRSSSRSVYTQSRGSSVLRPPPMFATRDIKEQRKRSNEDPPGKIGRGRLTTEHDFAAGWTFEHASSTLDDRY